MKPTAQGERTREDRLAGLTEQIRRDLAVLAGPETYIADRAFYEDRIRACREDACRLPQSRGPRVSRAVYEAAQRARHLLVALPDEEDSGTGIRTGIRPSCPHPEGFQPPGKIDGDLE